MPSTYPEILPAGAATPASRFLSLPRREAPVGARLDPRSAELGHDARNLVAALDLYSQLLGAPGVLNPRFACYADDLRRLAGSGARLIEALSEASAGGASAGGASAGATSAVSTAVEKRAASPSRGALGEEIEPGGGRPLRRRPFPEIEDLAAEVEGLEGLLRALAGPEVRLEVECRPCAGRIGLNSEDLLRILFNLVANAVEAMASTPAELRRRPFLRITAQRGGAASFLSGSGGPGSEGPGRGGPETVVLSVRDNGPGIAARHLPRVFEPGYSTRRGQRLRGGRGGAGRSPSGQAVGGAVGAAVGPRSEDPGDASCGWGLAIVQGLVAAAGGQVRAVRSAGRGARFDIELPVLEPRRSDLAAPPATGRIPDLHRIPAQIEKEA
jgi:signal transduction histidine kinase